MARAKKVSAVSSDPLDAMLDRLKLGAIRDQLDSLLDEAARANLSARETLAMLCEREITRKDHRRIEMGLKLAHFPAVKDLASFDFEAQPSLDPKQIRDLAAARWIANGENVLLLGPPESDSYCSSLDLLTIPALFVADFQTADAGVGGPQLPGSPRRD
jgi:DNA replication protein DnaC